MFRRIQGCYPGVLQDVNAENKHVIKKGSKLSF